MSILVGWWTGGRSDWPLLEQARALQLRDSDGITPFFPRFLLRLTPEKPDVWTLARFHQMRIVFTFAFQNVLPMSHQPLLSLIDVQPIPTKQDLVAVGFNTAKNETWVTRRKSQWGRGFSTSLSDSWMSMQTCSAKGLELRIPITEWADLSGWPEGKFHQIRLSQEI